MNRKVIATLVKVSLTAVVLGLLLRIVRWQELARSLSHTRWSWLLAMYAVVMAIRLVEALQLKLVLQRVGMRVPLRRVFLANSLGALYSFVVPGDFVASIAKWGDLAAAANSTAGVLNAIVYSRLALLLPPAILGAAALARDNPFAVPALPAVAAGFALAAAVGAACMYHPTSGSYADRAARAVARPLPGGLRTRLESLLESLSRFRALRLADHASILLVSTGVFLMGIVLYLCAGRAIDVRVSPMAMAWIWSLLVASRQLPITVSNLGVREAVLVVTLGHYGVEPTQAILLGLVAFTASIPFALIGAGYQTCLACGWASWKKADKCRA